MIKLSKPQADNYQLPANESKIEVFSDVVSCRRRGAIEVQKIIEMLGCIKGASFEVVTKANNLQIHMQAAKKDLLDWAKVEIEKALAKVTYRVAIFTTPVVFTNRGETRILQTSRLSPGISILEAPIPPGAKSPSGVIGMREWYDRTTGTNCVQLAIVYDQVSPFETEQKEQNGLEESKVELKGHPMEKEIWSYLERRQKGEGPTFNELIISDFFASGFPLDEEWVLKGEHWRPDLVTFVICTRMNESGKEEILLVQEGKKHNYKWFLPAGHLDPGETFADCGIRESLEETGLEVEYLENSVIEVIYGARYGYHPFHIVLHARWSGGGSLKTEEDKESAAAAWYTLSRVKKALEEDNARPSIRFRAPHEVRHILEWFSENRGAMVPFTSAVNR